MGNEQTFDRLTSRWLVFLLSSPGVYPIQNFLRNLDADTSTGWLPILPGNCLLAHDPILEGQNGDANRWELKFC